MAKTKQKRVPVVTRVRGVDKGMAVLVGRLSFHPRQGVNRSDVMQISVWCPFCKNMHHHGWAVDEPRARRIDHVEHRCAHCDNSQSPLREDGYYIALDPAMKDEHKAVFAEADRIIASRG